MKVFDSEGCSRLDIRIRRPRLGNIERKHGIIQFGWNTASLRFIQTESLHWPLRDAGELGIALGGWARELSLNEDFLNPRRSLGKRHVQFGPKTKP